jgi:hypothetical protein
MQHPHAAKVIDEIFRDAVHDVLRHRLWRQVVEVEDRDASRVAWRWPRWG